MIMLTHLKFGVLFLALGVLLSCDLVSSQWTKRLNHRDVSRRQITVTQPNLCDSGIQYSGYVEVSSNKHLFFWFFESRGNPAQDPLVLWLNGGPGCSSINSLYYEVGPCTVNEGGNGTTRNPNSWTNSASMIFLDQPTNSGYSYGPNVTTTTAAEDDVYAFLQTFFDKFPQYSKLKFHIAGESYGGHYVPVLASNIKTKNSNINLESILIANGLVNPLIQFKSLPDIACNNPPYQPVLDNATCAQMTADFPKCASATQTCYNTKSPQDCINAFSICFSTMIDPLTNAGFDELDIRKKCSNSDCFPGFPDIEKYSNSSAVKTALGVDPLFDFELCNRGINDTFVYSGDCYIPPLLENNVRVLVYAGDADYLCSWLGNDAWTKELDWSGKAGFNNASFTQWITNNGTYAGDVRTFGGLTFLKVFNAAHMVAHDQPEASLDFFSKWILNKPL
ncbi:30680_t:CDS:2 [Racocetra persica]|uniref:30680_t:CDS:1 n=1 Tax=Racocetra persica TaxID=160502 RepID=A0ACA9LY14_9GLOM|nr:30680_t:CDS:2 [Racocetra persica]